jgi:uncharacterized membrane protein YgdD (TMEM256/DUF423 family)
MNQYEGVVALMVPILTSIGAFTMIVFLRRYQYLERMAMLERGINPKDVQNMLEKQRDPYRHIRIACTMIGVGVGLFVGNIAFRHQGGIILGMTVMLGGVGLFTGYLFQYGLQQRDKSRNADITDTDVI